MEKKECQLVTGLISTCIVNLLFIVHCLTIMAVLAHLNQNVRQFHAHFIFIQTAVTHLNPNLKKFCAQFSLYSGSFLRIPTDFGAASIFLARFRPRLLGKKFAEDLRGLGKSSNILNFIYQCLIWRLLRENNG